LSFKEIAQPLIERGVPVIPLLPRTKIAFSNDWPNLATTDPAQIERWDTEYPGANGACVAKAEPNGVWFFEVDNPDLTRQIEVETGQKFPKTFRVRSRPGRGHIYWRHSAASIELAQSKAYYSLKKDGKEECSARLNHAYVVAPGSTHPETGLLYQVLSTAPIAEAPQWLIDWIKSHQSASDKLPLTARSDGPKIPRGSHDNELTRIAGKLRQDGMEEETIADALIEICEKRCEDYGSDYQEMCRKIAHSIGKKPIFDNRVLHNGVPVGPIPESSQAPAQPVILEAEDGVKKEPPKYPEFPTWVMYGTSIYEGLVKPFCEINCRYPEFMFMPAMALMLNYLGTKVYIEGKRSLPLSMYMVIIGRKGKLFKSASIRDAMEYFRIMGILEQATPSTKTADAKTLVWSAGSPEGFLIDVNRAACKNAILFYDELTTLTNKASIDTSNMIGSLLTAYEGGKLQNAIKDRKSSYSIEPGTYCISLLTCSTDQDFRNKWSKLSGDDTGLDDRFFFLYQPERLRPMKPFQDVNYLEAALATRKLIDKAVQQGKYKIVDDSPLLGVMDASNPTHHIYADRFGVIDGRCEWRAEKWALAFAIDMGRDEIDEECIERGLALSKYENEVKSWLRTFQAETREGRIQQEIMHHLGQAGGQLLKRDLERLMHANRYGTSLWWSAYSGLIKNGWARQDGDGTKVSPYVLVQIRAVEEED
jgi:Bifunctional DNA primase/polymerase, N-terminal